MHVADTIFIFCLALIIFGPKKLPEIGRQIGKLMVEFRRASNEFKMQIDEELRASEEAERQKEIAAAAAKTAAAPAIAATALSTSDTVDPAYAKAVADEEAAKAETSTATVPVIAPPSTGLPVERPFSTASADSTPKTSSAEASYPEPSNGFEPAYDFNPGLNTASNGLNTETPLTETPQENAVPVKTSEATAVESDQAPVHHG